MKDREGAAVETYQGKDCAEEIYEIYESMESQGGGITVDDIYQRGIRAAYGGTGPPAPTTGDSFSQRVVAAGALTASRAG